MAFDTRAALQAIDRASATPKSKVQATPALPLCKHCNGKGVAMLAVPCDACKGSGRDGSHLNDRTYYIYDASLREHIEVAVRPDAEERSKAGPKGIVLSPSSYTHWRDSGMKPHPLFSRAAWENAHYRNGIALPRSTAELCLECKRPRPCECKPKELRSKPEGAMTTAGDYPTYPTPYTRRENLNGASEFAPKVGKRKSEAEFFNDLACSVGVRAGRLVG